VAFSSADAIADRLALQVISEGARLLPPSWNVAPTNLIKVINADQQLEVARWGLTPPWPTSASGLINARIETAATKPAFASAFGKRRCIVPVDGYYEWQKITSGKQPWFISGLNDSLYFAGIYNVSSNGEMNVAILTMPISPDIADIHHRMPVSFQPDLFARWLGGTPDEALASVAVADQHFTKYPVSTEVNSVRNNGPHLIEPAGFELTLF
jgi:putative SOS response-associated peptidase YedK